MPSALVRRPRACVALSLCCACLAARAFAQAQDTGSAAATTLDGVVVVAERATTATKTDTALTQTPQAVSVVTSELFEQRGALNLQETLRYSAGVTAEAFGLDTRGEATTMRGLDVTQYVDGLRRVFDYSPIPRSEVYTLDRIELLRGPSSVLYGAGTSGGIVNAASKQPQFKRGGEIGVQVGSYDRRQLQFDLTGPLGDAGTLAGRLVGVGRDSGMQTDRLSDDRVVLAPSLTWLPTERTRITFIGLRQRDDSGSSQQFLPVAATLLARGARRLPLSTFLGDEDYDTLQARQTSGTVLVEHRAGDALTLRSNSRYVDARTTFQEIYPDVYTNPHDPFIDDDDRVLNRSAYGIKSHIRTFNTDNSLEAAFDTGRFAHRLLAGVDAIDYRERSSSAFADAVGDPEGGIAPITPIDIYDPVSTGVVAPPYVRDPDQHFTQLGLYAQDQVRYADRVSLVVGVRHDRARTQTQGAPVQTDDATTFRVGVIGEIVEGVSPYASYSESFLPVPGLDVYDRAFVPIRGKQLEAGVKWVPARNALVTADVYRINERNRATNDPDNVLNTIQTGEIRSQGAELEVAYAFANDLALTAAYAYDNAEVTRSTFAPEVGQPLSDTPRHLASAWATRRFAVGDDTHLRIGVGGRYVGSTLSTAQAGSLRTPSYALADALVEVELRAWSFALNATNLFDKRYFAPCRAFGDCFTGNGRVVVGTLAFRF